MPKRTNNLGKSLRKASDASVTQKELEDSLTLLYSRAQELTNDIYRLYVRVFTKGVKPKTKAERVSDDIPF